METTSCWQNPTELVSDLAASLLIVKLSSPTEVQDRPPPRRSGALASFCLLAALHLLCTHSSDTNQRRKLPIRTRTHTHITLQKRREPTVHHCAAPNAPTRLEMASTKRSGSGQGNGGDSSAKRARGGAADDEEMDLDALLEFERENEGDVEMAGDEAMLASYEADLPANAAGQASVGPMGASLDPQQAAKWRRPDVPADFNPKTSDLAFQWISIDMTVNRVPLRAHPRGPRVPVPGASEGPVPMIRMYGVTEGGNSVSCMIHGFSPYLFCILPRNAKAIPGMERSIRDVSPTCMCVVRGRGVEGPGERGGLMCGCGGRQGGVVVCVCVCWMHVHVLGLLPHHCIPHPSSHTSTNTLPHILKHTDRHQHPPDPEPSAAGQGALTGGEARCEPRAWGVGAHR